VNELVKSAAGWRKSTYSVSGECVEVGWQTQRIVAVRDSTDVAGSQLIFASNEWREFVNRIKLSKPTAN
jgi:hypothetical protein